MFDAIASNSSIVTVHMNDAMNSLQDRPVIDARDLRAQEVNVVIPVGWCVPGPMTAVPVCSCVLLTRFINYSVLLGTRIRGQS